MRRGRKIDPPVMQVAAAMGITAPQTLYAEAERLAKWFARAEVGATMVYATGPGFDPKHPTAILIKRWLDERVVVTHKSREQGVLVHLVRRCTPHGQPAPPRRLRLDPDMEETPEGAILRLLARCANMGLPCPNNAEIARAVGLRDAEAARYRFNLLKDGEHIRVQQDSTFAGRRVLVVATGRWTAESSSRPAAALHEGRRAPA